ncbi:hypothetical protein [Veronia pacifica]|uniref:Uncharacterized protein n=1 Tax=Veronia pacifica TaxID=1080227 RepID=A0A1C3EIK8_9GAMM|nr:hypothetical protein [Veronia pacifica]ODA33081.1 hypothetical protein A8L45_11600 [Veronia pacifica]
MTSTQLLNKNKQVQALKDQFKNKNPSGIDLTKEQAIEIEKLTSDLYEEFLGEKQAQKRQKDIFENVRVAENKEDFDLHMKTRQEAEQVVINREFEQKLSDDKRKILAGKRAEITENTSDQTERNQKIFKLEREFLSKELDQDQQLRYIEKTEKIKQDHKPNSDFYKVRTKVQNAAKIATLANSVTNAIGNIVGAVDDAKNLYDENGNVVPQRAVSLASNVAGAAVQTGLTISVAAKTIARATQHASTAQLLTRSFSTAGQLTGLLTGPLSIWAGVESVKNGQITTGAVSITSGTLFTVSGVAAVGSLAAGAVGATTAATTLGLISTGAGYLAAPVAALGLSIMAGDGAIDNELNRFRLNSAKRAFAGETYSHSYEAEQKKNKEDTLEQKANEVAKKYRVSPRVVIANDPQVDQMLNAHPTRPFGDAHDTNYWNNSPGYGYSATTGVLSSRTQADGSNEIDTDIVPLAVDLENGADQIEQNVSIHRVRRGGAWQVGTLTNWGNQPQLPFREAALDLAINGEPAQIETEKDFIITEMSGTHNVVLIEGLQPRRSDIYSNEKSLMDQNGEEFEYKRLTESQRKTLLETGTVTIKHKSFGGTRQGEDRVLTFQVNPTENNKDNHLASTTVGHIDNPFTPRVVATSAQHPSIVSLNNIQRPTEVTIRNGGDIVEVSGPLSKPILFDVTQLNQADADKFNKIDLRGYAPDTGNAQTTTNVLKGPGVSHFDSSRDDGLNFEQAPNQQVTGEEILRIPVDGGGFMLVKMRPDQTVEDFFLV